MSEQTTPSEPIILSCFSGPDHGKRLVLTDGELSLGRSAECNLLSDDPDARDRHVVFRIKDRAVVFQTIGDAVVFVDGHTKKDGTLATGQQLRVGRSLWQLGQPASAQGFTDFLGNIGGKISDVAGIERIQGFDFRAMFSEVFGRHSDAEIERYFSVGSETTTPDLSQVDSSWPKPWVFVRTFLLALIVYGGFVFAARQFDNRILVPGLIVIGSFAIPLSILVFFFEVNILRNVSLYQVIKLVMLGGIVGLVGSLFLFRLTGLHTWLGAMSAGIIEEVGKAAALLLIANKLKYRWTLNGLLFGAAVGAGFSGFESAGYAYVNILRFNSWRTLLDEISGRGIACLMADHTLWTALVGAALWRVKGDRKFSFDMALDIRFLRVLGLAMAMHMVNNAPIRNALHWKEIVLGFVAWVVILGFIQAGLKEVRAEQAKLPAQAS